MLFSDRYVCSAAVIGYSGQSQFAPLKLRSLALVTFSGALSRPFELHLWQLHCKTLPSAPGAPVRDLRPFRAPASPVLMRGVSEGRNAAPVRRSAPGSGQPAVRIFVLALLNMLFVSIWCIEFLRGLLFAPILAGKALGIVMLIFIAINAVVVITGLDKQELDKEKKLALSILLGGSVLCALLTFFSPEWVDVLMHDVSTVAALLLF